MPATQDDGAGAEQTENNVQRTRTRDLSIDVGRSPNDDQTPTHEMETGLHSPLAPVQTQETDRPSVLGRTSSLASPTRIVSRGQNLPARSRGATISARSRSGVAEPDYIAPISRRAQTFRSSIGRDPSTDDNNYNNNGSMNNISEARPSMGGGLGSSTSRAPDIDSGGLRPRLSSQSHRPRGYTLNRVSTAMQSNRGDDQDFTLAGPSEVAATTHAPYVDPGYVELNPAYEQPNNTRPVWGLAKPLPRVVRPGMVPSASEINRIQEQPPSQAQPQQGRPSNAQPPTARPGSSDKIQGEVDLEKGKLEPIPELRRAPTLLQEVREDRERRLLEKFGSRTSAAGRVSSIDTRPLSIQSEVVEDAEAENNMGSPQPPRASPSGEFPRIPEFELTPHSPTGPFPEDRDSDTIQDDFEGHDQWFEEELPLATPYVPEDEVHNHHTRWSVIRTKYREPLAELLAVIVQLTIGFCADLVVTCAKGNAGNEATTDWAWGLASMTGIYIAGGISGAHLNPAISIMLYIYRGFPLRKVPSYVLAQLLGAFIAGLIAYGLYRKDIIEFGGLDLANGGTMNAFITNPRYDYIDAATAWFNEFVSTAFLSIAVLALGDDSNAPPGAGMSAFVMGLVITVLSMAFGYDTGAAMNPSRDFGPRLALLAVGYGNELFLNWWWFCGPWLACISGAIFGAAMYDVAIFDGGESPINYPKERLQRAGHKWKLRMKGRIKKAKRKVRHPLRGDKGDNVK